MSSERHETFWAYREAIGAMMRGESATLAADPAGTEYAPRGETLALDERLIQAIWAQQLFSGGEMRLADGRPLRVLDAGRWNGAAGPDFKEARLLIDDRAVAGDVEIHIDAGDWTRHGHQRDLDYNAVALHAVLRIDDGRQSDVLHNGGTIPRLELEPYIFPDLETLRRSMTADDFEYAQPADFGRCHRLMTELDAGTVADFLDRAGEERLVSKTRRLEDQALQADPEQVFYQSTMMSLGSGAGKTLYYLLAKRTPLAELCDYAKERPREEWALALEALLLAVAGLLPNELDLAGAPEESVERARRLTAIWKAFEPYWSDRAIPPTRRWFLGIRPQNFPTRRLAGMAILLARSMERGRRPLEDLLARLRAGQASLKGALPARKRHPLLVDLLEWFLVQGEGHFWGRHYSFTAKPAARPMTLIGEGAATSLFFNAFLPAALMAARKEGDEELADSVIRLFALVPPLQSNHITEFMTKRLFGETDRASSLINTERRRQALFQIFHHCCRGEERHCDTCYYLKQD